jgi:hypothetical protein
VKLETTKVSAEEVKKLPEKVQDAPVVVDLNLTTTNENKESQKVDFGSNGGSAQVKVPFQLPEGKSASDYAMVYVDGQNVYQVKEYSYDGQYMTFTAKHFSTYAVSSTEVYNAASVDPADESSDSETVNNGLTLDYFVNWTEDAATIEVSGRTITVTCAKACIVAYTTDGTTYTKLTAAKVENVENTYSFTLDANKVADADLANVKIAVALRGDLDLSGKVDSTDAKQALRADAGIRTLTSLEFLIADIDGSNKVDSTDAKQMLRVEAGVRANFDW